MLVIYQLKTKQAIPFPIKKTKKQNENKTSYHWLQGESNIGGETEGMREKSQEHIVAFNKVEVQKLSYSGKDRR